MIHNLFTFVVSFMKAHGKVRQQSKGSVNMKLINITNSHLELVKEQLANTDANFVKVYSLGQTTVIHTRASVHQDIVIVNEKRRIKEHEVEFVVQRLFHSSLEGLDIISAGNVVEISMPLS